MKTLKKMWKTRSSLYEGFDAEEIVEIQAITDLIIETMRY